MSTKQCIQNFTPSIRKSALIRTLYLKETHTHTHTLLRYNQLNVKESITLSTSLFI